MSQLSARQLTILGALLLACFPLIIWSACGAYEGPRPKCSMSVEALLFGLLPLSFISTAIGGYVFGKSHLATVFMFAFNALVILTIQKFALKYLYIGIKISAIIVAVALFGAYSLIEGVPETIAQSMGLVCAIIVSMFMLLAGSFFHRTNVLPPPP